MVHDSNYKVDVVNLKVANLLLSFITIWYTVDSIIQSKCLAPRNSRSNMNKNNVLKYIRLFKVKIWSKIAANTRQFKVSQHCEVYSSNVLINK